MNEIFFVNRQTKAIEKERVYGRFFLEMLYGKGWLARCFSFLLRPIFSKIHLLSKWYGNFQKSRLSKPKIFPFIRRFQIDTSEFLDPPSSFQSFNDFFIRRLKPESRPLAPGEDLAILPTDGRYLVFPNLAATDGFWVKGKKFSLSELLQNDHLAKQYAAGAMAIIRLCPTDYHRFHFPCDCIPGPSTLINGPLYSVNPIALKRNIDILSQNKRMLTTLETKRFGSVLFIEVGATYVGTIHQTYQPNKEYAKGSEKGYFSFGGSCILLLFEPNRITFDEDLLKPSLQKMEVRGLLGQSLGKVKA